MLHTITFSLQTLQKYQFCNQTRENPTIFDGLSCEFEPTIFMLQGKELTVGEVKKTMQIGFLRWKTFTACSIFSP